MKDGTAENPKLKALARRLRTPRTNAAGILEFLWLFARKYAKAGDVGRFTDSQIADAVDWPADRPVEELISALVEEHWLDRHPTRRLIIHDWSEHADRAIHKWLAKRGENFADGKPPSVDGSGKKSTAGRPRTSQDVPEGHLDVPEPGLDVLRARTWPEPEPEPEPVSTPPTPQQPKSQPAERAICLDDGFSEFRAAAEKAGMSGSEVDWEEARNFGWRRLDFHQRLAAVRGIALREKSGALDDPALRALPKNYLARRMWERIIRSPCARADDKTSATRRELARVFAEEAAANEPGRE